MKEFFFVVFWGCVESYSMNTDLVNNIGDTENLRSVKSSGELPEHVSCVRMNLFHEMYGLFCSQHLGGDDFYDDMGRYDPPTPENGSLTLRDRYEAWAAANCVDIPVNGAAVRPGGPILP